jgi:glycerol-3-phosphate dehydrogenase
VNRSDAGVVTVTGGKLTTYREMAADAVDEIVEHVLDRKSLSNLHRRSRTKRLELHGADGYDELVSRAATLSPLGADVVNHLADRYGSETGVVLALAESDPDLAAPLVPGLPYLRAEAIFAVRHEMARTIDDILSRRTRARLLARDDSATAAPSVAALIGPELGWDEAEQRRRVDEYVKQIDEERSAPGLPEVLLDTAMGS